MQNRFLLVALATFGIPLLILIAEGISYFFQATPFITFATQTMPDLFNLISILWFALLIYTSTKLVTLLTKPIQVVIIRVFINVAAVFGLTMFLFFIGFGFMSSSISSLTIRPVKGDSEVSLTTHSSGLLLATTEFKR